MKTTETFFSYADEIPYLVRVTQSETETIFDVTLADTDFMEIHAAIPQHWRFPKTFVNQIGSAKDFMDGFIVKIAPAGNVPHGTMLHA